MKKSKPSKIIFAAAISMLAIFGFVGHAQAFPFGGLGGLVNKAGGLSSLTGLSSGNLGSITGLGDDFKSFNDFITGATKDLSKFNGQLDKVFKMPIVGPMLQSKFNEVLGPEYNELLKLGTSLQKNAAKVSDILAIDPSKIADERVRTPLANYKKTLERIPPDARAALDEVNEIKKRISERNSPGEPAADPQDNAELNAADARLRATLDNMPPDPDEPDVTPEMLFARAAAALDALEVATQNTAAAAVVTGTPDIICGQLFKNDDTNIFKELTCSVVRVASLTVGDLATNTTCTILGVGNSSNYDNGISFSYTNSKCKGENTNAAISAGNQPPFGNKDPLDPGQNNGIYKDSSQLTKSLNDIKGTFDISRGLMAILAFIALIFFAFANIAHYDINTYAVKKALPVIIIALVGGSISLGIVGILSRGTDMTYRLKFFDPYSTVNPHDPMSNIFSKITKIEITPNVTDAATSKTTNLVLGSSMNLVFTIGQKLTSTGDHYTFINGIFGVIMLTIPSLIVIALQYVLSLRPFAIQFLAIIAPFAFASLVLPQTQIVFRKWWTYLIIILLYAPIVNLVFYFLNEIGNGATAAGTSPVSFVAVWAFKVFAIIMLIRFPFAVESDSKKITASIAKSKLGETLGLNKIFGGALTRGVGGRADNVNLSSDSAKLAGGKGLSGATQRLVASVSPQKRLEIQAISKDKTDTFRANRLITKTALPNLGEVFATANKANLARPSGIILNSARDLSPSAFKAVIDQSDLKLWHDTRLIEQLKNKNGQVLDNEGAALRADSARKTLRLAGTVAGGKLQNPDAVKMVAQKGALKNLPLPIVQEAIKEGILQKQDLKLSYQNDTDKVFEHLQAVEKVSLNANNQIQMKALMDRDQKDYSTGYKDLQQAFTQGVKGLVISPQSSPVTTTKEIVSGMKNNDGRIFEKHGDYFLSRLSQEKSDSQDKISDTMQKNGVAPQTAQAIASNPQIDFAQAVRYMKGGASAESIGMLKQGFAGRDLSGSLITEATKIVTEERTTTSTGITKKIGEAFKVDDSMNLNQIEKSMTQLSSQMSRPMAPREAQAAVEQVNKFHPMPVLNTTGTFSEDDIRKARDNAEAVSATVHDLIKAGLSRDTIKDDPKKAQDAISASINEKVKGAAETDSKRPVGKNEPPAKVSQAIPPSEPMDLPKPPLPKAEGTPPAPAIEGLDQDSEFNAKLKSEIADNKTDDKKIKPGNLGKNPFDNGKKDEDNIVNLAIKDIAGEKNE